MDDMLARSLPSSVVSWGSAAIGRRNRQGSSRCMLFMVITMVLQILLLAGVLAVVVLRTEHVVSARNDNEARMTEYQGPDATNQHVHHLLEGQGVAAAEQDGSQGWASASTSGSVKVVAAGKGPVVQDERVFKELVSDWPYICWSPSSGMSSPMLTMMTVIAGLPAQYIKAIRMNRLQYASRHGYRYCELQVTDQNKIAAFSKLPWMLALAPCSDFLIHVDADAMFVNLDLPLGPWIQVMQAKGIDQLLSKDIVMHSPINFGVFMIRTSPWIWNFYRKVYNMCACDWSRMNDWPAEQGIIYDLIAEQQGSIEANRSLIVSEKGWNHIIDDGSLPQPQDVLVHIVWPKLFPNQTKGDNCNDKDFHDKAVRKCKYIGLMYYLDEIIGSKHYNNDLDIEEAFITENNSCQQVRRSSLFVARTTYSQRIKDGAISASVMDFDINVDTDQVQAIKVSEVGCLGYDENKCDLKRYWNWEGHGPWEPIKEEII